MRVQRAVDNERTLQRRLEIKHLLRNRLIMKQTYEDTVLECVSSMGVPPVCAELLSHRELVLERVSWGNGALRDTGRSEERREKEQRMKSQLRSRIGRTVECLPIRPIRAILVDTVPI